MELSGILPGGRATLSRAGPLPQARSHSGFELGGSVDKPGSVVDSHSSGTRVATGLKRPTRTRRGPRPWVPIWSCSGWGLPCHRCCQRRGALLPHLFTLTRWLESRRAVPFLRHFP